MSVSHPILLAFLGSLLFPFSAQAQANGKWEFIPQVGVYFSALDLGPVAGVGNGLLLNAGKMDPTPSLGLSVQLPLSTRRMGLTLRGVVALPVDATGHLPCTGICTAIHKPVDVKAMAWMGAADFLYRPFSLEGKLRPFLVVGVGLKQNRYSWPAKERYLVEAGDHTELQGTAHFGMGFDLELPHAPIRFEIGSYRTIRGGRVSFGRSGEDGSSVARTNQHEFNLSLGWRLLRF